MRHLITLDDLSNFEIEQLFRLADQMRTQLATWSGFCKGKLLATLFTNRVHGHVSPLKVR